jgi:hypothetical protein
MNSPSTLGYSNSLAPSTNPPTSSNTSDVSQTGSQTLSIRPAAVRTNLTEVGRARMTGW